MTEKYPSFPVMSSDEEDEPGMYCYWKSLTNSQKRQHTEKVDKWLEENYKAVPHVSLLRELVHQHFAHYSSLCANITVSRCTFAKMVLAKYPEVTLTNLQRRGKSFHYYAGLDIQKSCEEYHTVVKGRRIDRTKIQDEESPAKKRCIVHCSSQMEDKTQRITTSWRDLSAPEKETHWESTLEWLEDEYEVAPLSCLLRTLVYSHYLGFCQSRAIVPATHAIFGKMILKKFSKMTMRRLGVRGESKYYYMGIDIRSESAEYDNISAERIVCMGAKPKINRVMNGT